MIRIQINKENFSLEQYVVAIYDTGLNLLDTFISTSSASANYNIDLDTYYLRIFSLNGVCSASQNYTLAVAPDYTIAGGRQFTANGGQAIEVAATGVYINGTKINLDWDFSFYVPGQPGKYQWVITTYANTQIDTTQIRRGTLSCGSFFAGSSYDMSTSNCIRLKIGNISYKNYTEQGVRLWPSAIWIYVDVNKQKVVDAEINSYNSSDYDNSYKHTFTTTQIIAP
jgi:hypothetical protein